jgi:hypothetical protein
LFTAKKLRTFSGGSPEENNSGGKIKTNIKNLNIKTFFLKKVYGNYYFINKITFGRIILVKKGRGYERLL